eukprot:TRINITY_DN71174_c0_g1_i1.p1 TRINITY_DN71174_c0_g1~~TRINITY_DN71174_c0_g1_i1.p1  ORF type:complete len:569 (+),score=84.07 TRINITY_DN71174_c0_g1_i1:39-1745(+)
MPVFSKRMSMGSAPNAASAFSATPVASLSDRSVCSPHASLGAPLRPLPEISIPEDVGRFQSFVGGDGGRCEPCVLRRLATTWPCLSRSSDGGHFDPLIAAELRRRLGQRLCSVNFAPTQTFFGFEFPKGWTSSNRLSSDARARSSASEASRADSQPRLINPGRVAMPFEAFFDVCEHKRNSRGRATAAANNEAPVRVVHMSYDDDDDGPCLPPTSGGGRCNGATTGRAPATNVGATGLDDLEQPYDVPKELFEDLALYCVEDAAAWPVDVLDMVVGQGLPGSERLKTDGRECCGDVEGEPKEAVAADPAALLAPSWQPLLRERRVWMASGCSRMSGHVTSGFHWDHMQNIHVVLSGTKEVFLVPPMDAPALHATRFCEQAEWRFEHDEAKRKSPWRGSESAPPALLAARVAMQGMLSEESSSDYAVVMLDDSFEMNISRVPALQDLREVRRAVLHPGDALYIPPGWWHSIRTWPASGDIGLPFALSVNFWYEPEREVSSAFRAELFSLYILSCQRAMIGEASDHIAAFLKRSGIDDDGEEPQDEREGDARLVALGDANTDRHDFAVVD